MTELLHTRLESTAERSPEACALLFEGASMSYQELSCLSNQVAHALNDAGIRKGDRVGIYTPKGFDAVAGIYGILKAGALFVPLDPLAPATRIAAVVRDCGIRHLITNERMTRRIDELVALGIAPDWCLGSEPESAGVGGGLSWTDARSTLPTGPPHSPKISPEDSAYIFYTSGTTGEPKGMVHTHRSGLSFVDWTVSEFGLRSTDRVTSHAPLHFDLMMHDYFATCTAGGCTVIVSEARAKMPASTLDLFERERVTVIYLVPSALTQMLLRGGVAGRDLDSIRQVTFGGEAMPTKYLQEWMRILPDARFTNVYGVTECNVCTFHHVPRHGFGHSEELPLGTGLPSFDLAIVDADRKELTSGEAGELLVAGEAVMEGYWNRPDANATVFVSLEERSDSRTFLRTGDIVRRDSTGNLVFAGRADRQVKIRGNRVQLQDVEQVLLRFEPVIEAVAVPVVNDMGSAKIVAAIVTQATIDHSDFSGFVRRMLPWYAIPETVWITSKLPRTSVGKFDMPEIEHAIIEGRLEHTDLVSP